MTKREWIFYTFYLLLVLTIPLRAALTMAQAAEHVGRMLNRGFNQHTLPPEQEKVLMRSLSVLGRDWIVNGNFGTVADRREAMQIMMRQLFTAQTGLDPRSGSIEDGSSGLHLYKRHWLPEQIMISQRDIDEIEP